VEGAVNLKSVEALDELLLSEAQGLYGQGNSLPTPSKGDEAEGKVVLVFHCEFSAKRAPTL
jgi:M-phase inducer tyrosine phosphatase